jgi:hypothetical protein
VAKKQAEVQVEGTQALLDEFLELKALVAEAQAILSERELTYIELNDQSDEDLLALLSAVRSELDSRGIYGPAAQLAKPAPKQNVLEEALNIVNGARRNAYGHPENNFGRIADFWNAYLANKPIDPDGLAIDPQDVALMMVLMKVARLLESPQHRDSVVDIAGYAATVEMLWNGQ